MQRGGSILVERIEVGAPFEQQTGELDAAEPCSPMQGGLSALVARVGVGAPVEQQAGELDAALPCGHMQGGLSALVARVGIGAPFEQQAGELGVALPCGHVQGGLSALVVRVGVGAPVEHSGDRGGVPSLHSLMQTPGLGGSREGEDRRCEQGSPNNHASQPGAGARAGRSRRVFVHVDSSVPAVRSNDPLKPHPSVYTVGFFLDGRSLQYSGSEEQGRK